MRPVLLPSPIPNMPYTGKGINKTMPREKLPSKDVMGAQLYGVPPQYASAVMVRGVSGGCP